MATVCVQSLEDGLADQMLLRLPHVVFGLRLDKWLIHQQHRLSTRDLVGHFLHESVGHILEHNRLQRERGTTSGLGALN